MTASIIDYAHYVIGHPSLQEKGISPLKLQKVLYYIKIWGLVSDTEVFPEQFVKWDHGPVNAEVYQEYRKNGSNPIPIENDMKSSGVAIPKEFTDFIIESYAAFNAFALSALTHRENPWKETFKNQVITDESILNFYSEQPFAKNFPLDFKYQPYFPVSTDLDAAYVFDMDDATAKSTLVYSSFLEYKKQISAEKKNISRAFSQLNN